MSLSKNLANAEKKARVKDLEREKSNQVLSQEEMEAAQKLQTKAQGRGMILVPEKRVKNRDKFVQINQVNMIHLNAIDYIEKKEKILLFDISPYVGLVSNCLVHNVEDKVQVPMTLTELAMKIGRTVNNISPIVNSLINKGIIAKSETGLDGNNGRAYALYLNPNVMYSGNRDNVNPTLQTMFFKVPKEMRNLPNPLV